MSVIDWGDIHNSVVSELGKECQGWIRIVEEALERVKKRAIEQKRPAPEVHQIKQKFGELRIYYSRANTDGYQDSDIVAAITEANRCCQWCGNSCRTQIIDAWIVNMCCWCMHRMADNTGKSKPKFNTQHLPDDPLRCQSCGYVGQIAWKATGHRCPCCVSKGL
ncbi:hypothetical protein [Ruegeria faecimaris]|uniref:hypothetical protein n=1 Tax=Ruegeria faecimaris TaxID=686389 RepID=UPI0024927A81|nr:hypothetical protein [Ruegeria faecimaris]